MVWEGGRGGCRQRRREPWRRCRLVAGRLLRPIRHGCRAEAGKLPRGVEERRTGRGRAATVGAGRRHGGQKRTRRCLGLLVCILVTGGREMAWTERTVRDPSEAVQVGVFLV